MKKSRLYVIVALLILLQSCGGSKSPATPESTISISPPIIANVVGPITNISVSTPEGGIAQITGGPGAVPPGAEVRIEVLDEGNALQIAKGAAVPNVSKEVGAVTTVTASADGSFRASIVCSVGQFIRFAQIGEEGVEVATGLMPVTNNVPHLGYSPIDVAIDMAEARAYVVGLQGASSIVTMIDLKTALKVGTFPLKAKDPRAVAIVSERREMIVVDHDGNQLVIVNLNNTVLSRQRTLFLKSPVSIAMGTINGAPKGLIANDNTQARPSIAFLNLKKRQLTHLNLPIPPAGSSISSPVVAIISELQIGAIAAVFNNTAVFAYPLDMVTQTPIGDPIELAIEFTPGDMKFYPPNHGIVTNSSSTDPRGLLFTVDQNSGTFTTKRITLGKETKGIAIDEVGNRAFVVSRASNQILVINLTSGAEQIVDTKDVGIFPTMIAWDPNIQKLITINTFSYNATVLDIGK